MSLIPLRSPRLMAGSRAKGLQELYSAAHGSLGISAVTDLGDVENSRYNTAATVVTGQPKPNVQTTRTVFYSRMKIQDVFKQAGLYTTTGNKADIYKSYTHPISVDEVIKLLNGKYRCDFTADDISVSYINSNYYTIESKVNSLGYIGSTTLAVGLAGDVTLTPTENALIKSEQPITGNEVTINGRIGVLDTNLFTAEKIIFKEFTKPNGDKLTYFLNTNAVPLTVQTTVDITSTPATENLNETVHPSDGQFILAAYTPSSAAPVTNVITAGQEIRFSSWLDSVEKIDAVFEIKVDGVTTKLADIVASNDTLDIDTANDVIILGNKTYNPVNLYIRSKTVSLPALENIDFAFVNITGVTPTLTNGYEVYTLQMAAKVKPLQELDIIHTIPSETIYNSLLNRLGQIVGQPPQVLTDPVTGDITKIIALNNDDDEWSVYAGTIDIANTIKTVNADIGKNGYCFLDAFAINKEQWDILTKVDLNTPVINIVRKLTTGKVLLSTNFTVNQLLARGIWDTESESFIFGFINSGDWEGTTTIKYTDGVIFLPTTIALTTNRNLTKKYFPQVYLIDQPEWNTILDTKPEWATTYGLNVCTGIDGYQVGTDTTFTGTVNTTFDQIKADTLTTEVLLGIKFNQAIKPILDKAMVDYNGSDANAALLSIINGNNNFSVLYGVYKTRAFADLCLVGDDYVGVIKVASTLTIPETIKSADPNAGVSEDVVLSNQINVHFDADSLYGSLFTGVDFNKTVTGNVKFVSPYILSPEILVAKNQDVIVPQLLAAIGQSVTNLNLAENHFIVSQSNDQKQIAINVARLTAETEQDFYLALELGVTDAEYNYGTIDLSTTLGTVLSKSLYQKIDGKYYTLLKLTGDVTSPISFTCDVDGVENIFRPNTTVLDITVTTIEPPLSLFMEVDKLADDASQTTLLTHQIDAGYTDPQIDPQSPFNAFKTPLKTISGLGFVVGENGKITIDGTINSVNRGTLVGVEFKLYITEAELNAALDNDEVIGNISKVSTTWTLPITRSMVKRQAYIKDGGVYIYLLFSVTENSNINGDYQINVDWDGLNTNDSYILNGIDHNSFYAQTIDFTLDVTASFVAHDLSSPSLVWATVTVQDSYYGTESTTATDLYPSEYVSFNLNEYDVLEVEVVKPIAQSGLQYVKVLAALNITADIYNALDNATITITLDSVPETVSGVDFKPAVKVINGEYFVSVLITVDNKSGVLQFNIDLDGGADIYVDTQSTLNYQIATVDQKLSPQWAWGLNQIDLLAAYVDATKVTDVISPNYIGSVGSSVSNLTANLYIQGTNKFIAFAEFTGTDADLNAWVEESGLGLVLGGVGQVVGGNPLTDYLFNYNGKHYLPIEFNPNDTFDNTNVVITTDIDPTHIRYLLSTTTLGFNVTWSAKSQSPSVILASDQNTLLNALVSGKPDGDVVYSLENNAVTTTLYANAGQPVPTFFRLSELVANTGVKYTLKANGSIISADQTLNMVSDANNIPYGVLFLNPGLVYTVEFTTTVNDNSYIPTDTTVTATVSYVSKSASPTAKFAKDQLGLLIGLNTGGYNLPTPVDNITPTDKVTYNSINDNVVNIRVLQTANYNLPVFIDLGITDDNRNLLIDGGYISVEDGIGSNSVILSNGDFNTKTVKIETRYYLPVFFTVGVTDFSLTVKIDLDGTSLVYSENTVTLDGAINWVTQISSPTFTIAPNQVGILKAIKNGEITGVPMTTFIQFPDAWAKPDDIEYLDIQDTFISARYIGDTELAIPVILKMNITSEEYALITKENSKARVWSYNDGNIAQKQVLYNFGTDILFTYNGGYYIVGAYGLTSNLNLSLITDLDGEASNQYLPTTSNLIIILSTKTYANSPTMVMAANQADLLTAYGTQIPVGNIQYTYGKYNDIITKVYDAGDNKLPIFFELVNGANNVSQYTADTVVTLSVNGVVQNTLNGVDFIASLTQLNGKYYLPFNISKTVDVLTVRVGIDLDGTGKDYRNTISQLPIQAQWLDSIASPIVKVANNQTELYSGVVSGTIINSLDKTNLIDVSAVTYSTLNDTQLIGNVTAPLNKKIVLFLNVDMDLTTYNALGNYTTFTLSNGVSLSGYAFKNALLAFNGKYYYPLVVDGATLIQLNLDAVVDVDGGKVVYHSTTSNVQLALTWLEQKMSPAVTVPLAQNEILQAIIDGTVPYDIPEGSYVPPSGMLVNFADATHLNMTLTKPTTGPTFAFVFMLLNINEEQYNALITNNAAFSVGDLNGVTLIPTSILKDKLINYNGGYYIAMNFDSSLVGEKVLKFIFDFDGDALEYLPTVSFINLNLTWQDQPKLEISCAGAKNTFTFETSYDGSAQISIDGADFVASSDPSVYAAGINVSAQPGNIPGVTWTVSTDSNVGKKLIIKAIDAGLYVNPDNPDQNQVASNAAYTLFDKNGNIIDPLLPENQDTSGALFDNTATELDYHVAFSQVAVCLINNIITCDGAANETGYFALDGSFIVKLDGVAINNGEALTQAELKTYLQNSENDINSKIKMIEETITPELTPQVINEMWFLPDFQYDTTTTSNGSDPTTHINWSIFVDDVNANINPNEWIESNDLTPFGIAVEYQEQRGVGFHNVSNVQHVVRLVSDKRIQTLASQMVDETGTPYDTTKFYNSATNEIVFILAAQNNGSS